MAKKDKAKAKEKAEEEKDGAAEKPAAEGDAEAGDVPLNGKSKKKLIIIAAGALVLLLAAGGGAFFMLSGHKKEGEHKEGGAASAETPAKVEQPVYFDLPQMLVNLNTGGKQTSFIKATVTLELGSKEDEPLVQANLPRLMDSYNTFLREMRATDLYGSAGSYRLREEMLSRANTVLAPAVVKDVLFREILIQ